jgi:hypothetical protein
MLALKIAADMAFGKTRRPGDAGRFHALGLEQGWILPRQQGAAANTSSSDLRDRPFANLTAAHL